MYMAYEILLKNSVPLLTGCFSIYMVVTHEGGFMKGMNGASTLHNSPLSC